MMNVTSPTFLKPGARFDAYRIREWKGGGGYGEVYSCEREGRPYALKLSKHRQGSDDPGKTDQRLLRELVCLVHLDHPNIVKVLGWARTSEGYGYLVLEYVDGWTLANWLQHQRPTFQQVLRVFAMLADALAYMHRRGVKHRDVSLSNVMVRRADGEPVIIDLGAGDYSGAYELTEAPLPPGTNRYRSPEAALFYKEHKNDPSARYDFPAEDDLYSLAVCLYDALTDVEPARQAKERKAPRINVNSPVHAPPPARAANPRVPEVLSGWAERWLARDVEQRRSALAAMRGVLEELSRQGGEEWAAPVQPLAEVGPLALERTPAESRRRVGAVAVAAALLAAVTVAVFVWPRPAPSPQAPPAEAAPKSSPGPRAAASSTSPSQSAPAASAVPSPSEVPPVKKESPPVSPSPNPPPSETAAKPSKKAAPVLPGSLKTGVLAGLCAAGAAGCPGAQVTPPRGEACPPAAVEAMEDHRLRDGRSFGVHVNPEQPSEYRECIADNRWRDDVRTGCFAVVEDGEVVSEVSDDDVMLPKGTRLYGRLWTNGTEVVGRYTRAVVPPEAEDEDWPSEWKKDFPVCIALGLNGGADKYPGSKPGAAIVDARVPARFIHGRWP